jgi:cob(I)alamin adenosyltransferase
MAAIGDVDEANSAIGVAVAALNRDDLPADSPSPFRRYARSLSRWEREGAREAKPSGKGEGDCVSVDQIKSALIRIQSDLFDLGADLATPGENFAPSEMVLRIVPAQVARLEAEIDAMNADLAPLTSFVLPGGTPAAAALHLARAITRRAERSTVAAAGAAPINPQVLAYLNRLSDWLFVAARRANGAGEGDVLWVPGATR